MKNSTMKQQDVAVKRGGIATNLLRNSFKIILTAVLLMTASSVMAGIIFLPSGGQYINPELVPVNIQRLGGEVINIQTNGLTGEMTIDGSDFPPRYNVPGSTKAILPFTQDLDLVIDVASGTVSGYGIKQLDAAAKVITANLDVTGHASCVPLNGLACGQLVVDLELQGVVTDPNDPSIVGKLRSELLGSLVWDNTDMIRWTAITANTTIGGNEGLINSLTSMSDEEVGV